MKQHETVQSQNQLYIQLELPVVIQPRQGDVSEVKQISINHDNKSVLHALVHMDDNLPDLNEEVMQKQIRHLDSKLDLVLNMFSRLLQAIKPLPAESNVRLSARGCQFHLAESLPEGEQVYIEVVLNPRYPIPICLPAVVTFSESRLEQFCVNFSFEYLPSDVTELLEQYIFIQHRRAVAYKKLPAKRSIVSKL